MFPAVPVKRIDINQNALTVCNVALNSVVSDIFGKSSTSIIDYLLKQSGTSINHEEIASKLLRCLKSKKDTVIESIEGYRMTDSQKYRMRMIMKMLFSYYVPLRVLNMIVLSLSSPK